MPCQSSERCLTDGEVLLSVWQPRPLHLQLPTSGRNEDRCAFKPERGDSTEEGRLSPSRKDGHAKGAPGQGAQGIKCLPWTPFLNPDSFSWWYRIKNIARVGVSGEICMALQDNGTQFNTIMPGYVENHSLDIGPISDLIGRQVACVGLGNTLTLPIGYVIVTCKRFSGSRASTTMYLSTLSVLHGY